MAVPPGLTVLRTGQVAELLAVSAPLVRLWARTGRIPCYRLAGSTHWRYLTVDILAFAAENECEITLPEGYRT